MLKRLLLMGVLLIVGTASALADKQYTATVVSVPGSPVTMTSCEAWARDWNMTVGYIHKSSPDYYFDLGVSLTNASAKPVTAVRVMMTSYDSFNAVLGTANLDTASNQAAKGMNLAPGSSFDLLGPRSWHGGNGHSERDHVTCEVTAVKFSDGSVWAAPIAASSPAPTSSQ